MKSRNLLITVVLALSLGISQLAFVCTAQNVISQILTWLPTIEQAIVAILQGVTVLQGTTVSAGDINTIQSYQTSTKVVLADLTAEINAYQAVPSADTLAKINAAYQSLASQEAALLPALHIVDPSTQAKVEAGIGLVGVAINTVGALISELNPPSAGKSKATGYPGITVSHFKSDWNKTMKASVANASCDSIQ